MDRLPLEKTGDITVSLQDVEDELARLDRRRRVLLRLKRNLLELALSAPPNGRAGEEDD